MMRLRRKGLTLIEVVVAMAILGLTMSMLYMVLFRSSTTYTNMTRMALVQENGRRVMDQIANEIRMADTATLVVAADSANPGNDKINFRTPAGYKPGTAGSPGTVSWSTPILYQIQASPYKIVGPNNQVLALQGRIVRLQNGVAQRLCDYVNMAGGFVSSRTGDRVDMTLTFVVADERNKVLQSSVTTSVMLRNDSTR